jgi:hypothetical protein
VEQQSVREYTQRAGEAGWRELSELVGSLPYPAANPLGKFLGATVERDQRDRFAEAFEGLLIFIATIAYLDYCATKGSKQTSVFKQFKKSSAGPLWGLIQGVLSQKPKGSMFIPSFQKLVSPECEPLIKLSIDAINDHKHHRTVSFVDYYRVLGLLGNTLGAALTGWQFGYFEEVKKKAFSSKRAGIFRAAHGGHAPFVDIYHYEGEHDFSELEAVLANPVTGSAFRLAPILFWTSRDARGESTVAMLDSLSEKEASYRSVEGGQSITVNADCELSDLFTRCALMATSDPADSSPVCSGIGLRPRGT